MQWRLHGSPPEEVSHASSRVPLAETLLVQLLLLWQWSRTSLFQPYDCSLEASVPAATTVEADLEPIPKEVFDAALGNSLRTILRCLEDIAGHVNFDLEMPICSRWSTFSTPTSS